MRSEEAIQNYYAIIGKLDNKSHFLIYALGDKDYLLSENDRNIVFTDFNRLKAYANQHEIIITEEHELASYDFDYVQKYIAGPEQPPTKSSELMNCWNLFDDLHKLKLSTWSPFSNASDNARELHQMLLFESEVFGDGDCKPQQWSSSEIARLKNVLSLGLTHFKAATNIVDNISNI